MTSNDKSNYDIEYASAGEKHHSVVAPDESGAVHGESFVIGDSFYAKLQRFAGRFGVEQRGIERVPEDERTDKNTFKLGTMWLAANMTAPAFAIGVLAVPIFYLGFVDSFLIILFVNLLAVQPVAFFSTFGPKFGLRQMILSRFYFGYYGVKLVAFFNCLACLGWSAVNIIVGAQLIHVVNSDIPGWAGIIIIAACTFFVTLFGYKVVHWYEMISWVPCFIVFLIVLGTFAHTGGFDNLPMGVGEAEAGSALSFAASVLGFAIAWTSFASDYACYQPVNTKPWKVYVFVSLGLLIPLCFTEMLGLAISTAVVNDPKFAAAYAENSVGGLFAQVLFPHLGGFGKFCLVIMSLSIVGNNCPNIYSLTFSLQILTHHAQRIPRFLWTFIGTVIYVALAIPGYSHFESYLEDFMLLIGYWLGIYLGVALPEHFIFRRGFSGYAPHEYDQPSKLPPSIAALGAVCFGILGAVMGMAQVWFIGPIGKLIGTGYGGDIGFLLSFSFTFITYCVFRHFELKKYNR